MFTNSRTRTRTRTCFRRLTARGGGALVTAVAIAAGTQAAVTAAQASVTGGQPVTSPYSLVSGHPSLRNALPSVSDGITVTNPGPQRTYIGGSVALQIKATAGHPDAFHYAATGLPPGLAINPVTGLITGTATVLGSYSVTVTVIDHSFEQGSATFPWTIWELRPGKPDHLSAKHPAGNPASHR